MAIDIEKRAMACSNDKGFVWMSGPVVKPLALATVYTIKQAEQFVNNKTVDNLINEFENEK